MDLPSNPTHTEAKSSGEGVFPDTAWTLLLEGQGSDAQVKSAWEKLAHDYWQPLYVFLRHRGIDHHSAADEIQGFFEHLLHRDFLQRLERGDGLFRSLLLTSLQHWRTDQYRAATAQKRGGQNSPLSLEELETGNTLPISASASPEENFDRTWARQVFNNALATLAARLKSRGREPQFQKLRGLLTGQGTAKYRQIARDLGMSEGAVKQSALEMRREFGTVLRDEIRRTVVDEKQIDGEIRYLLDLLQR